MQDDGDEGGDRCGVVFVATGADYVDLAIDAAESVRRSNPGLPVDLFTDRPDLPPPGLFDRIHPTTHASKLAKLTALPRTRFERTLFLDCDTRVVRDITDLFRIADRFDLAIAHDVRRKSALVQEGWRIIAPYAFPQHNSGVMVYRRSPAMLAFLDAWIAAFTEAGAARDQVTLRDLLWSSDLRYYVLPPEFNLRRVTMLDAWEPLDAWPTIFHSHIFLRHLRDPSLPKVTAIDDVIAIERENLKREWAIWNRRERGEPADGHATEAGFPAEADLLA